MIDDNVLWCTVYSLTTDTIVNHNFVTSLFSLIQILISLTHRRNFFSFMSENHLLSPLCWLKSVCLKKIGIRIYMPYPYTINILTGHIYI